MLLYTENNIVVILVLFLLNLLSCIVVFNSKVKKQVKLTCLLLMIFSFSFVYINLEQRKVSKIVKPMVYLINPNNGKIIKPENIQEK